jgi:gamma-glutamyl-gamma-aminobutyrate hydrolase PuuD
VKRVVLTYRRADKAIAYADAARKAGIEPVLVSPDGGVASLEGFDGLLLTGGTDVNAALYGQEPGAFTEPPDPPRDELEQRLLLEALECDLPVLAICRGLQLLNVSHPGGTLFQHVPRHQIRDVDASVAVHDIEISEGTRLAAIFETPVQPVNSRHHQIVAVVGDRLVVSARAAGDRVVEGLERPDRRFVVAVQWHPEDQLVPYPQQFRLFTAFGDSL